jgi:heat shock protein beta
VLLGAALAVSADDTEVEEIEDITLEEAGTKAEGIKIEEVKPPADVFTAEERATVTATSETHEFQAEVTRLMDILINSLYSNREIFLRELISNAADACDKLRYQALTSPELLREGEELGIQLSFNKAAKTITITDMGVGMTKADLITNLGVVAKSGTSDFLDKASNGDSLNLIGQFGVGFYSVYLVANKVTVISKHSSDDQHIWESTANSQFTITKDPRGNTLGRGTSIVLHLKDDAQEYMDEATITRLVGRYSQFIDFPISLKSSKTVTRTVELTEEEIAAAKAETKDEEDADTEDDEEEEEVATTKEVSEVVDDWKVLNLAKPIWTRNPKDISEEDYTEFYKTLTKASAAPLDKIHFVAEGEISFKAILYIPETAEADLYDKYQEKSNGLKLYVRRVLISDEFDNFLPRYMNFVKGLVDSDDLPINVSRETLTQTRILKVMAKKITRKVLEMLRKMEERSHTDEEDEEEDGDDKKEDKAVVEGAGDFDAFYAQYSKSIKLGVIEDKKNRNKLVKLLRYQSSKSNGKLISFEDYVDRAKENQNNIFYMTCSSIAACEATPVLEKFVKRGFEVHKMSLYTGTYVYI